MDEPGRQTSARDRIPARLRRGIELSQAGDRAAAREHFAWLWRDVVARGDPLDRCMVAHQLADLQDDPGDELAWDTRALAAAWHVTEAQVRERQDGMSVARLYPSLYLNVADCHRRLGNSDDARAHFTLAREAARALADGTTRAAFLEIIKNAENRT